VAGLSRLYPSDERARFAGVRSFLTDIIDPLVLEYDGNIFKHTGDLALVEFGGVVEAARCGAALRGAVAQHNHTLPHERRLAMRIRVNLGEIIAEGGGHFGDGVNIAARLEALAEPGSILVSEMAYHHIADKVDFELARAVGVPDARKPSRVRHC
jgi:adenylate cyclase